MASGRLDRGASEASHPLEQEGVDSALDCGGPLPTFLIIGAMRSGTTALLRYLGAHPDTYVSRQKELHFFDSNYEKGLNWYRAQFSAGIGKAAIGEATPLYMYDSRSLERMAKHLPNAKLIAILRNPVERAYSHFWHQRSRGREKLSFVDALRAEPNRISQNQLNRFYFSYVDRGRYIQQLEEVERYYPRDRVLVLIYEDFFSSVTNYYRELCRYLDIDETVLPPILGESFGVRPAIRSGRVQDISKRMKGPSGRVLRRLNASREHRPPMDPSIREQLLVAFRSDNDKLSEWLGQDLEAWSK